MKHIFKPLALLMSIAAVSSLITACESEKSTETETEITSEKVTAQTMGLAPEQWQQVNQIKGNLWLPQPAKLGYALNQFHIENRTGGGPGSGLSLDLVYTHPVNAGELGFHCMSSGVGSLPSSGAETAVQVPEYGEIKFFPSQGGLAAYTQFEIEQGGLDCHLMSRNANEEEFKAVLKTLTLQRNF